MRIKTGAIFGGIILFIGTIVMIIPLALNDFNVMAMHHLEFVEQTTVHENITSIEMSLRGESVKIIRNDELEYVVVTRSEYESDERFTVTDVNYSLNIRKNGGFWLRELRLFGHDINTLITIEMPNNMINTLRIEGRSGKIELAGFTFDNLEIHVRSGRIDLYDITVNNQLRLNATSGRITANNIDASNAQSESRISASSGRINIQNSELNNASLSASSGSINVSNSTINILRSTVRSGRMTFTNFTTQIVTADAHSGRITMRIYENDQPFSVAVTTRNGSSNIQNNIVAGSPYSLTLGVRSGRIGAVKK